MIVCIESNFVLEVALGQEQATEAEEILGRAERDEIELAIPSFSLAEPFSTVTKRLRDRERLAKALSAQAQDLNRSSPHQHDAMMLMPLVSVLAQIGQRELDRLAATVERLLQVADIIQIDLPIFRSAMQYRSTYGLSEQDAIVLAAVVSHLATRGSGKGPHYFVSRNSKDFDDPGIEQVLSRHNCAYVPRFNFAADLLRQHGPRQK